MWGLLRVSGICDCMMRQSETDLMPDLTGFFTCRHKTYVISHTSFAWYVRSNGWHSPRVGSDGRPRTPKNLTNEQPTSQMWSGCPSVRIWYHVHSRIWYHTALLIYMTSYAIFMLLTYHIVFVSFTWYKLSVYMTSQTWVYDDIMIKYSCCMSSLTSNVRTTPGATILYGW